MNITTWLNIRVLAGVGMAALLADGGATLAVSQTTGGDQLTAREIAGKAREAYAALSSYKDDGRVVSEMAGQKNTLTFNTSLQRPALYRVDWTQGTASKGVVWSDGSGDYMQATTGGQQKEAKPQKLQSMKDAFTQATGLSWASASTISGLFFGQDLGDLFSAPILSGRYPLQREKDGKVGDVDCYVVSSERDLSKQPEKNKPGTASTTLWIGKADSLIRQCRTKYVEKVDDNAATSDEAIDAATKKSLEMQNKPATPEAIAAMRPQMKAIMKQVQTTLKAGFEAGVVTTQTREHILLNEKFSSAAFTR